MRLFNLAGGIGAGLAGSKTIFKIKIVTSPAVTREPGEYLIVKAFAELTILGIPQFVSSRGMGHIEIGDEPFLSSARITELEELHNILIILGFPKNEIDAAVSHATYVIEGNKAKE
jgi:hypothetical protein